MWIAGIIGFGALLVALYGVADWVLTYSDIIKAPAVVAVPQLILMALQAGLGFLTVAVVIVGGAIVDELRGLRKDLKPREPAPAAAPPRAAVADDQPAAPVRDFAHRTNQCPACGHFNWRAATVCASCGSDLGAP